MAAACIDGLPWLLFSLSYAATNSLHPRVMFSLLAASDSALNSSAQPKALSSSGHHRRHWSPKARALRSSKGYTKTALLKLSFLEREPG